MSTTLLEPVSAGQTRFRLPGLGADARGIAVGREFLARFDSLDRLVAFLGAYSDEGNMDELLSSATVERGRRVGGGHAMILRAALSDSYALERLDRLARSVRGVAYTGAGSSFVRGKDRRASFGYDLGVDPSELALGEGKGNHERVRLIDAEHFAVYELVDRIDPMNLILGLRLRPRARVEIAAGHLAGVGEIPCPPELRELALLLVAPGVADRVMRYLWRKGASFSGVGLCLEGDQRDSFLVRLRHPRGRLIQVLEQMPGVEIFAPVSGRAAVEFGWAHPVTLASLNRSLPGEEMLLFRGRRQRVERLSSVPRFVAGAHLVDTTGLILSGDEKDEASRGVLARGADLAQRGNAEPRSLDPLRVPLRIRPSARAREARGLWVEWEQLDLLRRLLHLVPPSALAGSAIAGLEGGLLLVAATQKDATQLGPGAFLPVGRRLWEVAPGVLIPDGTELWPRLRAELVSGLLGLEEGDRAVFVGEDASSGRRVAAASFRRLDEVALGALSLAQEPSVMNPPAMSESPELQFERLGRFALWGFRGGGEGT